MIDALFGSKTRVKLLHLFLSNPGKSFYVREITRLIDEQINSVRRELSNMLSVGVIKSNTSDNKLYYEVDQRYKFYTPLRLLFVDEAGSGSSTKAISNSVWRDKLERLKGAEVIILAGALTGGVAGGIDLLVAGDVSQAQLKKIVKEIELELGHEVNYTTLLLKDYAYRKSIRDKFIFQVISGSKSEFIKGKDI